LLRNADAGGGGRVSIAAIWPLSRPAATGAINAPQHRGKANDLSVKIIFLSKISASVDSQAKPSAVLHDYSINVRHRAPA